ncbi:hypothetical protein RV13_GL001495 [Enterococcus raffinosus]|nr:hypothetical protein RV13_GL001495 [Enterococcus raffinosus]
MLAARNNSRYTKYKKEGGFLYLIALLIFVILVGSYNIFINLARRKKKNVTPLMVNIQVTLNLILIVAGLVYLFFG